MRGTAAPARWPASGTAFPLQLDAVPDARLVALRALEPGAVRIGATREFDVARAHLAHRRGAGPADDAQPPRQVAFHVEGKRQLDPKIARCVHHDEEKKPGDQHPHRPDGAPRETEAEGGLCWGRVIPLCGSRCRFSVRVNPQANGARSAASTSRCWMRCSASYYASAPTNA